MNCETFESRSHHLLDRRECLAADEQLAEHAASCDHCWSIWQAYQLIGSAFPSRPLGTANGRSFATRVIEQCRQEAISADVEPILADSIVCSEIVCSEFANQPRSRSLESKGSLGRKAAIAAIAIGLLLAVGMLAVQWPLTDPLDSTAMIHGGDPLAIDLGTAQHVTEKENQRGLEPQLDLNYWASFESVEWSAIGGESLSVVRPLTRPLQFAYDILLHNLWLSHDSHDAIPFSERWRLILDNVA